MDRIRFYQANCREDGGVDSRQADLILRCRPSAVFWELPAGPQGPASVFNRYPPTRKPAAVLTKIKRQLTAATRRYPYAQSDILTWDNIQKLWADGLDVQVFNVDGPSELRRLDLDGLWAPYPACRRDWLFWVYLLSRERMMASYVEQVLAQLPPDATVAILMQSIHWRHIRFLMTKPTDQQIWQYYLGRFPDLTEKNLPEQLRHRSRLLYKYWLAQ